MSQEHSHARWRSMMGAGLAVGMTMAASAPASAGVSRPSELPGCGWRPAEAALALGPVAGVEREPRTMSGTTRIRIGRRATLRVLSDGRVVVGLGGRTVRARILITDGEACRLPRSASIPALAPPPGAPVLPSPASLGAGGDAGATGADVEGECPGPCDDEAQETAAAFLPAGVARPVPMFAGGPWSPGTTLDYRWRPGAVPPTWAKAPLKAAAADASETSWSRSPRFVFEANAKNTVRYTASFPSFCRTGIGCAHRDRPNGYWATWLRPHGTVLPWGTLRWCQKKASASCYDLRRVQLHELGHVAGLNHPETQGSRLPAGMSIMTAVTPRKDQPGGSRHRFGACDRAALQRAYDVQNRRQRIAPCQDLVTKIRLWSDRDVIDAGGSVRLRAELTIADRDAYERLGGNKLDRRAVRLRFRRAGSSDGWTTAWMEAKEKAGRYELTVKPSGTWEYRATFPTPDDEGLRAAKSDVINVKVKKP